VKLDRNCSEKHDYPFSCTALLHCSPANPDPLHLALKDRRKIYNRSGGNEAKAYEQQEGGKD